MIRMSGVHQKPSQSIESDDGSLAPTRDGRRTLNVIATYRLSEEGRKLSLITGGDGRAVQQETIVAPANRLHLVSVSADGVAMLRLSPQYHLNASLGIVKNDAPPIYDAPPSVEELFKDAARNHQLERAYNVERGQSRDKIHETKFEAHQRLAERFLNRPEMRALRHPKPTPRQCYVSVNGRPVLFDTKQHRDLARQVPPEAYRRFMADEHASHERGMEVFTREAALHDERVRFTSEWVATHGTYDQRARHASGMLSLKEVLEALADEAFAMIRRPHYTYDGVAWLQRHLRRFPKYSRLEIAKGDVAVTTTRAETATEAHWALRLELEAAIPDAKLTMRIHRLALKSDSTAPRLTQRGVLVFKAVGPFTVKREWLVTDGAAHTMGSADDIATLVDLQKNFHEE